MKMVQIGSIISTHGLKGSVKFYCEIVNLDDVAKSPNLVDQGGNSVKIKSIKSVPNTNVYIMSIDGVNSINSAKELIGKKIFATRLDIAPNDDFIVADAPGYKVFLEDGDGLFFLGKIREISNYGSGNLIEIDVDCHGFDQKILTIGGRNIKKINKPEEYIVFDKEEFMANFGW